MSHHFSMATVFRMTPYQVLGRFFLKLGLKMPLDWEKVTDVQPLQSAYRLLPRDDQERTEDILKRITPLACKQGYRALNEAAKLCNFPKWEVGHRKTATLYQKVIWTWMLYPHIVEKALTLFELDKIIYARKRFGLPLGDITITDEILNSLKLNLQSLFTEHEGRGRVCTIEVFERGNGKYCFFAYPDDYPENVQQHDQEERLIGKTECNTFEIVFGLNTEDGTLELAAKANDVGQKMKGLLEETFVRTVYGIEPPPYVQPLYVIDMLKNERFPLVTDPEDCIRAEIAMFQIKWDYRSRSTRFGVIPGDSVYDSISCYESRQEVSRERAEFQRVKIRFYFGPKPDRRAGMITAEIAVPGTCIIGCHDQVKVDIVHKYLRRWGISLSQNEN
jgi:hypothetical protein